MQLVLQNGIENMLPCNESDSNSPEISTTEDIPSVPSVHSTEETSSLVFRHKNTENTSEAEPTQNATTANTVTSNNSRSSILSSIGIWLIVLAIVVLLLRRLFL